MSLDPEKLRHAMRSWTTGVAIVTSIYEGQQYGMTVNSFTSISLEPPLVSLTLKKLTHTHELVEKSGEFAVTVLASNQKEYSDRFAGKHPEIKDRFEGVPTETLLINAPLLKGGIAVLPGPGMDTAVPTGFGTTETVGLRLFTHYLLQFEITGLLMLASVIGAVVLAKRKIG
jgi:hypothetical protein